MACLAFVFPTHDATRDGRGVRTLCAPRQREPGVDGGSLMVPRTPVGVGARCGRRDHGGRRGPGHGRSAAALAMAVRHDRGLGHRCGVRPNGGLGHWRWLGPGIGLGTGMVRGLDMRSGHRRWPCVMTLPWAPTVAGATGAA